MYYLLKTEPSEYSFQDLQRERSTSWDGVTNPVALKHLREMKKGDRLIIYHTGDEKCAVGQAAVEAVDVSDPKKPRVRIKAGALLRAGMTLADIKTRRAFADSPLVRQGRLSVVPLTQEQYDMLAGK